MHVSRIRRGIAFVGSFGAARARDAMIFDSRKASLFGHGQVGPQIIQVKVEADVPIEVAILRITWKTLVATPDLPGGCLVTPENSKSVSGDYRRERAVAGTRVGLQ